MVEFSDSVGCADRLEGASLDLPRAMAPGFVENAGSRRREHLPTICPAAGVAACGHAQG